MGLRVAAAPNVDDETREEYRRIYEEALRDFLPRANFILVLTGGSEPEILANAGDYNILLAWPHYNSLPAALEATAALRESGKFAEVIQLEAPGSPPPAGIVERILRVVELLQKPPRLALVGAPNKWLVASDLPGKPDVAINEEEVYRKSLEIEAAAEAGDLLSKAEHSDFGVGEIARIMAYAKALREAAKNVDGLTLGCWCFDFEKVSLCKWTPCISLAVLNDWGITATCEGDLRALYSAVVLKRLSGKPSWISNVNSVGDDVLLLTHDGAPPSFGRYSIVPRMATRAPAALRVEVPPGLPVTLLRVSSDLKKALLLKGVTIEAQRVEACSTQVAVRLLTGRGRDVLRAGLGNHLAYVLDDVYEEARLYFERTGAVVIP
ncbi:fucose isomerase [Pyrobaculum aerophilum]|uniref:fucose isomerase n=1 Tax=Pyrobaculum aerophilum TaxID=13773 RepID=UPI002FD95F84